MRGRTLLAAGMLAATGTAAAAAAEYVAPPVMPVPGAWQGKAQAVVRVLNKLDTRVEVLTLAVNQPGSVGGLQVTPRSCLVRPDGLPRDAAALLAVHDAKAATADFSGWMFSAEPSVGVFESPVYGVQLVGCAGADVAPMAPPLPPPVLPPAAMQPNPAPDAPPPDAAPPPDPVYPDGRAGPDQANPDQASSGQTPARRPAANPPGPVPPVPGQPVPDQPPPDQPDPDQAPPQLVR